MSAQPVQRMVGTEWLRLRHAVYSAEYASLVAAVALPGGGRVLDAGCGPGTHLEALAEAVGLGGDVAGCDIDLGNVECARSLRTANGARYAAVAHAGLEALPFAADSFDAVWCANVFQYLDDAALWRALRELTRVLRAGGVLAVKDSDMLLWWMHPVDPLLMHRLIDAGLNGAAAAATSGSLRGRLLRRWLEDAGLLQVRQRAVLLERWAPLPDAERSMYAQWLRELAAMADQRALSEADRETWRRLADEGDPLHPLQARDFYACEGQVIAWGIAP